MKTEGSDNPSAKKGKGQSGFLKKHYKKRIKKITGILALQPHDFKPEVVHKLRVEIKKIMLLVGGRCIVSDEIAIAVIRIKF